MMIQGLVDTKKECVEFLQDALAVPIAERIYTMYLECQKKGLKQFQIELSKISKWNNHMIGEECRQIIEKSGCSYLQKILKTTITTCVNIKFSEYKKKINKIKIKIPDVIDFIHKCFINTSNYAWKHTYLFVQSNLKQIEIQNNMNIFEHNTRKAVSKAVSEYINVEYIYDQLNEMIEKSIKKKKAKAVIQEQYYETNKSDYESEESYEKKSDIEDSKVEINHIEQEYESDNVIDEGNDDDDDADGNECKEDDEGKEEDDEDNECKEDDEDNGIDDKDEDDDNEEDNDKGIDEDDEDEDNDKGIDEEDEDQASDEDDDEGIENKIDEEDNEIFIDDTINDKVKENSTLFQSDSESDTESLQSEKSLDNDIKVVKINDIKPKKLTFF